MSDYVRLPAAAQEAALHAEQLICVQHLAGSDAELSYYVRDPGGWSLILAAPAHVGRDGVGKTREGDMKTPLGCFSLSTPFGILPDPSPAGRSVEGYLHLDARHYWCGQEGPHYNRLIDCSHPPEGYHPSGADEHLIDYAPAYHYGMFIGYNIDGLPGLGSAIFLHCTGRSPCTAGCVAVAEEIMRRLISEIRPGAKIVIYQ